MVHEMIDGTYRQTNLTNESTEYLSKREELRQAEIELMKQRERVAALRRGLPKGATVQNYEFLEGPASLQDGDEPVRKTRLSELFTAPDRSLIIYHFSPFLIQAVAPRLGQIPFPESTAGQFQNAARFDSSDEVLQRSLDRS